MRKYKRSGRTAVEIAAVLLIGAGMAACGGGEATTPAPVAEITDTPLPEPTSTEAPTETDIPPTETPTITPSPAPTAVPYEVIEGIPYIEGGDPNQTMDIYLPDGEYRMLPTLFMIVDEDRMFRHFAGRGYTVLVFHWRPTTHLEIIQDAFCAMAWTHANAETYGIDPGYIVAVGHSLGGADAALVSVHDDPAQFMENCPHSLPEGDRVRGIITLAGVSDFSDYPREINMPEVWPKTWIDGSEPPFLLIHGTGDRTTDVSHSEDFADVLERAGVSVELLLLENVGHMSIVRNTDAFRAMEDFLTWLVEQDNVF